MIRLDEGTPVYQHMFHHIKLWFDSMYGIRRTNEIETSFATTAMT